jgi:hypothetical protein
MKKTNLVLLFLCSMLSFVTFGQNKLWQGDIITVTKLDNADFNMAANQDRITDSVWITRKATASIFNIKLESQYSSTSPAKTLWAFGTTKGLSGLTFDTWNITHGGAPQTAVNKDMVLFLVDDSIYLDLKFSSFSGGGPGGGFSYERSTNIARITKNETACKTYTSPSGKVFTESTNFMDTVIGSKGTDSLFTINLTVKSSLDATFNRVGNQFSANLTGATYQWMDCQTGLSPISNEINKDFTATKVGLYALEVSQNGCKDTSVCYNHASLANPTLSKHNEIFIYPNPAQNYLTIELGIDYTKATVTLYSLTGNEMYKQDYFNTSKIDLQLHNQPKGFCFLAISLNGVNKVVKLIIE